MIHFEVTNDHIKLIRRLRFGSEGDWFSPSIDHKRPYGNSDICRDIADIIGLPKPDREQDGEFTSEQLSEMSRLNQGVATALDIGVKTGSFVAGIYVATSQYVRDWKRVES